MTEHLMSPLSEEQLELWNRVLELWSLSQARNPQAIESALHPENIGSDMSTEEPHVRYIAGCNRTPRGFRNRADFAELA